MKTLVLKLVTVLLCVTSYGAISFASLSLDDDITWNIIGLDSNKPTTDGPNLFPVGVRACASGTSETNVTATFVWDSGSFYWDTTPNTLGAPVGTNYINLSTATSYTVDEIAAGECQDFYFEVEVTRDSDAFDTIREFHIEVSSDTSSTQSTTIGDQLYVERLVSQNRNNNINIVLDSQPTTDPVTVYVGDVLTFTGTAKTATNGYEQLEAYFGFDPDVFRIISIDTMYSAGTSPQTTLYSDSCTWDETPANSSTYKSCLATGKAGGDLEVQYTVEIIDAGTGFLGGLVYDFSGSSYHYNSDFGTVVEGLTYTAAYKSDLSITKTDNQTTAQPGDTITYEIVVSNTGPSPAINAIVTDTFPAELENISWTCTADTNSNCDVTSGTGNISTTADIENGESVTYTVSADVIAAPTQDLSNTATVASPAGYDPEDDLTNNSATDTTVIPRADLSISKTDGQLTYTPGGSFSYTLTVINNGPSDVAGALVEDAFSSLSGGFTNIAWTCATTNSSCISGSAIGTEITTAITTDINQLIDIPNGGTLVFTVSGTYSTDMTDY